MKNDMRMKYPVWQMGFIVLLMLIVYFLSKTREMNVQDNNGYMPTTIGLLAVIIIVMIAFRARVARHNRLNPDRKISMFTIRPPEYMEDDEWFTHATRLATQKVYTFYVWAIPFFTVIVISLPFSKTGIIIGVLMMGLVQYYIFYHEMKKSILEDE